MTTARPVLATEAVMVARSSGTRLLTSTTSADTPDSSSNSAAALVSRIIAPQASRVTSVPGRSTAATPMGVVNDSSGTCSFTAR
jgi:hypothetical protein